MARFCHDAKGSVRSHNLTADKVQLFSFICRGGTLSHMCRGTLSSRHASIVFILSEYSVVERKEIKLQSCLLEFTCSDIYFGVSCSHMLLKCLHVHV